jgi:hypothetical protein
VSRAAPTLLLTHSGASPGDRRRPRRGADRRPRSPSRSSVVDPRRGFPTGQVRPAAPARSRRGAVREAPRPASSRRRTVRQADHRCLHTGTPIPALVQGNPAASIESSPRRRSSIGWSCCPKTPCCRGIPACGLRGSREPQDQAWLGRPAVAKLATSRPRGGKEPHPRLRSRPPQRWWAKSHHIRWD